MRVFILSIMAVLGLSACNNSAKHSTPELHGIGIYEGHAYEKTIYLKCIKLCEGKRNCLSECNTAFRLSKTSMTVPINLKRPQKSVTLILGSYDTIEWDITRGSNTKIDQILLIGYGANQAT